MRRVVIASVAFLVAAGLALGWYLTRPRSGPLPSTDPSAVAAMVLEDATRPGWPRHVVDPADYAGYSLPSPLDGVETGDVLVGPDARMGGLNGVSLRLESSYFKWMDASFEAYVGGVPIFADRVIGQPHHFIPDVALALERGQLLDDVVDRGRLRGDAHDNQT
jgi:hypothetical protein